MTNATDAEKWGRALHAVMWEMAKVNYQGDRLTPTQVMVRNLVDHCAIALLCGVEWPEEVQDQAEELLLGAIAFEEDEELIVFESDEEPSS
jgi:hypothetical protein